MWREGEVGAVEQAGVVIFISVDSVDVEVDKPRLSINSINPPKARRLTRPQEVGSFFGSEWQERRRWVRWAGVSSRVSGRGGWKGVLMGDGGGRREAVGVDYKPVL